MDYDSRRTGDRFLDAGSTPAYSTIPCFDEHLSIKVFKTRIYLICGIRNPYEAESEKWQNSCQLSIGGVIKWVNKVYGLDISKSSVCSVSIAFELCTTVNNKNVVCQKPPKNMLFIQPVSEQDTLKQRVLCFLAFY